MDNTEVKDFVLNQDNIESMIVSSTDELDSFDFSSNNEFEIDKYHELIAALKKDEETDEMKEIVKYQEAKNIIERDAKKFLDSDFVDVFHKEEENLVNMIKKFDTNKDEVRNLTEEQKDKIYEIAQYLFNSYQKKLNDLTFSFPMTKEEVKFVFDVFKKKLEYDQNEIFQLQELRDNYLEKDFEKLEDGNFMSKINVNDLIIFYHLISKYKVKGITQEHYDYLQILTKIGERIKLFNAYNVVVQRLSTDFQFWGGTLSVEGELVGKALEPAVKEEGEISVVNKETGEMIN